MRNGAVTTYHCEPFDESVDVVDQEEVASPPDTSRSKERPPGAEKEITNIGERNQANMMDFYDDEEESDGGASDEMVEQHQNMAQSNRPKSSLGRARLMSPANDDEKPDDDQQNGGLTNTNDSEEDEGDDDDVSESSAEIAAAGSRQHHRDDEQENGGAAFHVGGYDPASYQNLNVTNDVHQLFKYIQSFTPAMMSLDTQLLPFVPEYMPSVGDIDAYLKMSRPDGVADCFGYKLLDEPSLKQSDPHILELELRSKMRQTVADKSNDVVKIISSHKNKKELNKWIESIQKLRQNKPSVSVNYIKNMPPIDNLMREWPEEFDMFLRGESFEGISADLDCSLNEFIDLICAVLDVPVYQSRAQSLHVLFTLFLEFRNSHHFISGA